jgi:hypothetical protein
MDKDCGKRVRLAGKFVSPEPQAKIRGKRTFTGAAMKEQFKTLALHWMSELWQKGMEGIRPIGVRLTAYGELPETDGTGRARSGRAQEGREQCCGVAF